MGPETRNRAPSAINFKSNLWRPVVIAALSISAAVYSEKYAAVNSDNNPKIEPPAPTFPAEKEYFGSITIQNLKQTTFSFNLNSLEQRPTQAPEPHFEEKVLHAPVDQDRESCQEIKGTDYNSDSERDWY